MATYGRNVSSEPDFGYANNAEPNTKVTVFKKASENGWVYRLGGYFCVAAIDPGTCPTRLQIGTVDDDLVPDQRMGYTNNFNVTAEGNDQYDTSPFTATFAAVDLAMSPSTAGVMIWNGKNYYMGPTVDPSGAMLLFAMRQAALIDYPNEVMYCRNLASATPPDPFNHSSASIEGILTCWADYDPNVAPNQPTSLSPSGFVSSLTPTFTSDFVDGNENRGDRVLKYKIEVRQGSTTGTLKWNSMINANSSEQAASATSVAYGGTSLSAGLTYYWRITHYDMFGEPSTVSAWQSFTVNSGGAVATPTSPSGKQETLSPTPFQAVYTHGTPLSTNAVKVQIRNPNGSVVATSNYIAKVVANGGTISVTWAETAFPAGTLAWGRSYTAHILARDSSGLDTAWSAGLAFSTNAYPTVPTNLTPANNLPVSSYPKLEMIGTDPDDTTGTGLTAFARIKDQRTAFNPGFEVDNTKWNLDSQSATWTTQTLTRDTGIFNSGVASGRFNVTPPASNPQTLKWKATDSGGTNPHNVPAVPGESYTVRGWIRSGLASMGVALYIDFYNASNVFISGVVATEILSAAASFSESIVTGIAPANTSYFRYGIRFRNTVNSTANVVYLDDVSIDWSTRFLRTMTLNVTTNKWEYQTTSTDLPAYSNYRWDSYMFDGTLNSAPSAEALFIYGQGPSVTPTNPTNLSTITNNNPLYSWTTTNQTKYRLLVYLASNDSLIYDSGWVVSASGSAQHGSGYLYNDTQYYYIVGVENNLTLVGYSAATYFTVDYVDPSPLVNFSVNPINIGDDTVPTANIISWNTPAIPPLEFKEVVLMRKNLATGETIILQRVQNVEQTVWYDYFPQFGINFEYSGFVVQYYGSNEEIQSQPVYGQSLLPGRYPVLTDVRNGGTYRVVLQLLGTFGWDNKDDVQFVKTWGESDPTAIVDDTDYDVVSGSFNLITDRFGTAQSKLERLLTLKKQKTIVCYRDARKTYFIGYINVRVKYGDIDAYEVEISLTTVAYAEGVS